MPADQEGKKDGSACDKELEQEDAGHAGTRQTKNAGEQKGIARSSESFILNAIGCSSDKSRSIGEILPQFPIQAGIRDPSGLRMRDEPAGDQESAQHTRRQNQEHVFQSSRHIQYCESCCGNWQRQSCDLAVRPLRITPAIEELQLDAIHFAPENQCRRKILDFSLQTEVSESS